MQYFGDWQTNKPDARTAVPIGAICNHCAELVTADDSGVVLPHIDSEWRQTEGVLHRECLLRTLLGSVGHQQKLCTCYGGTCEDPPGMTIRQAALAAVRYFEATLPVHPEIT